jgi:hypothetical protein
MARRLRVNHAPGRRALLWGGVIFCAAQLATGVLLDFAWSYLRFPGLTQTLAVLRDLPRSPDVLCLGSSRLGTAFREQVIEAGVQGITGHAEFVAFNAGQDGADLAAIDLTLERILGQGMRPTVVVLEVCPETLAERNFWLAYEIERQWTWWDAAARFPDACRSRGTGHLLQSRLLPLYHYRHAIRGEICARLGLPAADDAQDGPRASPHSGLEWKSYMQQQAEDPTPVPVRIQNQLGCFRKWLRDYRVGGHSVSAFERLVARCRENDVAVVLVAPPLCSQHCRLYSPTTEAAFLDYVGHAAKRHGCQFVDYRGRLPDDMFQDCHHVAWEGGQTFSRQLASEVLAQAWLARLRVTSHRNSQQTASRHEEASATTRPARH